ncbi:MAG: hypothetical protein GEV08_12830 [Acidimicrobiia bacterium]|nr:hypothetical protein [Acidimicrobiia bacterium]
MDDRRGEGWSWRRARRSRTPPGTWTGEERRRRAPRPVDPGLRALLDDLARLDGRQPVPGPPERHGAPPAPGPAPAAGGESQGAEVVVLPSARPSTGAGRGWAQVVDLEAFRARRNR